MANQTTNVSNSYESTLSASLGAGDTTINVSDTSGTPGVPFFVTIDPGDDSKREVVLVDQGKTGTTLTLSSSSQRGQDGTTDVDHDANAVIGIYPIAALWDDINDRVDQHTHGGGSDGAQVDHGGLGGLGDDDHTQYSLTDGTRAFTSTPGGIDHGSLDGLADFDADHGTEHDARDHGPIVGDLIATAEGESSTSLALTSTAQTMASGTIDIDAGWTTYNVQITSYVEVSPGTPTSRRSFFPVNVFDGTIRGPFPAPFAQTDSRDTFVAFSHVTGLTTTGTVSFEVQGRIGTTDDYTKESAQISVLAVRTS